MANVCSCYMTVTGNPKERKDLLDLILSQDPSLDELFTWFLKGSYYGMDSDPVETKNEINIAFTCKWSPPEESLLKISEKYPLLTFETRYEESGMTLYGVMTYLNGDKIEDISMDEETYLMKYDEDFKDAVLSIETKAQKNYNKFLKGFSDYMKDIEEDNWGYIFERIYLGHIKTEDLPLLINHKWIAHNEKIFLKRLKGK